jgi:hypothetical protein
MNIGELMNNGQNALLVVSMSDLKEFAMEIINEVNQSKVLDNTAYTAQEFADKHHVDVSTLWRWKKQGILKPTRIGGRVFLP